MHLCEDLGAVVPFIVVPGTERPGEGLERPVRVLVLASPSLRSLVCPQVWVLVLLSLALFLACSARTSSVSQVLEAGRWWNSGASNGFPGASSRASASRPARASASGPDCSVSGLGGLGCGVSCLEP